MARDPPTPSPALLEASPQLRDLDLRPSAIKSANPVIIHPQLRDLILPLERGRVLYPRGGAIEELSWTARSENEDESMDLDMREADKALPSARTLVKLNFTPNCLVANKTILAAGGQHGELYVTNAPNRNGHNASAVENNLANRFPVKALRPFNINLSLQSRSINNSMVLLPTYPAEWAVQADQRRIGYIGSQSRPMPLREDPEAREMDDQVMDLDGEDTEEEDEEEDEPRSPLTYPNNVPFQHAPRLPHLSSHQGPSWVPDHAGPSRRTASFSDHLRSSRRDVRPTRLERQSFSIPRPGTGMPPIEYVTSRPMAFPGSPRSPSQASSSAHQRGKNSLQRHNAVKGHNPRIEGVIDEPRLLISNNDLTVKMFSLRSVPSRSSHDSPIQQDQDPRTQAYRAYANLPRAHEGSGQIEQTFDDWSRSDQGLTASRVARERLQRQLNEFQRIVGMQVSRPNTMGNPRITSQSPPAATSPRPMPMLGVHEKDMEERKLVRIGGSKFKCAINHSSLSPDLRNMVSVGDSEEVYLFEVVEGGREFRKIATYKGATDSSFSTSWSRDGRKFAVASQDGQVTVWDHRSSVPLAKFFSTRGSSHHSSYQQPSFSTDLLSHLSRGSDRTPILLDPVTGDARVGSSSSGREAARVVKFSPPGAPRDLLVFSEESSNIHVIDAQTLNTHVVLPVPASTDDTHLPRAGHEGGTWGIAGVAFDPTGQWLYSGTERTVVEWDMRGGSQSQGAWDMA